MTTPALPALAALLLTLAGCGDPCAPRRDCKRSHEDLVPVLVSADPPSFALVPQVVCDEYGPEYVPAGCADSGKEGP